MAIFVLNFIQMRLVERLLHPNMLIQIFSYNGKYILQFTKGNVEVNFKFPEEDVKGVEGVKSKINGDLFKQVDAHFEALNQTLTSIS